MIITGKQTSEVPVDKGKIAVIDKIVVANHIRYKLSLNIRETSKFRLEYPFEILTHRRKLRDSAQTRVKNNRSTGKLL